MCNLDSQKVHLSHKSVYLTMCEKGFVNGMKKLNEILQGKHNETNKIQIGKNKIGTKTTKSLFNWLDSSKFDKDEDGNNGLHLAVSSQNVEMVEYLLQEVYFPQKNLNNPHGLEVINQKNNMKQKPLVFACRYSSYKIVPIIKLLIDYSKNIGDCDIWFAVYSSACSNNIFVLKYMFDNQLGIKTINSTGEDPECGTPLAGAIAQRNVEAVEILCKHESIDINTIVLNNITALDLAAYLGNGEVLKILLRTLMKNKKVHNLESLHKCLDLDCLNKLKSNAQESNKAGNQCELLLEYLIKNYNNYFEIAIRLRYDIHNTIRNGRIPNCTVVTDFYPTQHIGNENQNFTETKTSSKDGSTVDRWTIHEELGRGAFGRVERGIDNLQNNMEVALKFISINKMVQTQNEKKRLKIIELIVNEIDTVQN